VKKTHRAVFERVFITALLFISQKAAGGGFQQVDQSARTMSIGGTMGALIGDPTAIRANPGLLSFLDGTIFSLGATVKVPDQRFYGVYPSNVETKMQAQVLFPPSICLTYSSSTGFGAGISVTVPYLIQTEWDQDWVGSRLATKSDLRVTMVMPAVSMKLSEDLSVGLGLELALPRILYEQRFPLVVPGISAPQPDGVMTHDGDGNVSYGLLAGVFYRAGEVLSLGASYRTHMDLRIEDGRVRYRGLPAQIADQFPEGQFSTTLVLPNQFLAAVTLHPLYWLNFSVDLEYILWSEFGSVRITHSNPTLPDVVMNQNWRNVADARFGIEAVFSDFSIRGGIRFEQSPVPDQSLSPGLPDAGGTGYSLGFGYRAGEGLVLDFAYSIMQFNDRSVSNSALAYGPYIGGFNGIYTSQTASLAINVTYSWN
jgi:long-chain fatty acid transport protein